MTQLIFYSLPVAITASSVLVVTATSPVVSVLYVVGLFLLTASYLIMHGLAFVGLVYLVVYVGAVAVLFLFVVMMLNVPLSAYSTSDQVRSVPLVAMLSILFLSSLFVDTSQTVMAPSFVSAEELTTSQNQAQTLASELFTHQAVLLVIVGIVLLLAMVGPVSMSMTTSSQRPR